MTSEQDRTRPLMYAGTCSYEGHVCCPLLFQDRHRVIKSRAWINHDSVEGLTAMIAEAFEAGYNAGKAA